MANLQAQGVPIPSKLNGPAVPNTTGARNSAQTPSNRGTSSRGSGTPQRVPRTNSKSVSPRKSRGASLSAANPAAMGASVTGPAGGNGSGGVALLEAEFLIAGFLLVMLMFADSDSSLADKIMSTMKRGTLICAVFFVLALIAGVGPHASKFAKAFGALVIVAIVVTAPVGTVLTDLDNVVKNDWVATDEKGDDVSADAGTNNASPSSPSTPTKAVLSEAEKIAKEIGQPGGPLAGPAETGIKKILGLFGISL
jgi:hypothetical protein